MIVLHNNHKVFNTVISPAPDTIVLQYDPSLGNYSTCLPVRAAAPTTPTVILDPRTFLTPPMEKQDVSEGGQDSLQPPSPHQDCTTKQGNERNIPSDPISDSAALVEDAATTEDTHEYLTGLELAIVMANVTMVAFLIFLDTAIIATAIPRITARFHSIPDIGWYASAYLLANCSLQPLSGKLYTHFSSKCVFLAFLGIFEFGSLLCGVAVSSKMLIVGRAVAGMGSSGLTNGALTIITASVPLKKRPVLLGGLMAVGQLGTVFGPLIGGALTQYASWRWCFYINLPAGAVTAAVLIAIRIPDRVVKDEKKSTLRQTLDKLDLFGAALFASTMIMFLLALQWGGQTYAWSSATVIGLFLGAFANLCIFVAWERHRGSTAMIPLAMLRKRVVYSSGVVTFFQLGNLIVTAYYMSIWFQVVKDASPTLSGVYLLPSILSQMLFAILSGILVGRLGQYLPFVIFGAALLSIGSGLMTTFTLTTATGMWIGFQILAGSGRGNSMQMPLVAVQNALTPSEAAIGTSIIVFSQYFGGALFSSVAETIFTNSLSSGLRTLAPEVAVQKIISAGASNARTVAVALDVPIHGVLLAYNRAVTHTFYLTMGAGLGMFVACWGMGWKGLKGEKATTSKA